MRRLPLIPALSGLALLWAILASNAARAADESPRLVLEKGDHIVFVGNTFAERLAQFGYFETLLNARLPNHELVIRNMGWPADTPSLQPRPLNFGDVHTHLAGQKTDVVFLCFGMNESFDGPEGLPKFERELNEFIKSIAARRYNGETEPRMVLISPIPHERLGGHLPDPTEHNRNLQAYTEAMRKVARINEIPFVDLYTPLKEMLEKNSGIRLTFNGIHLTQFGDWVASQVMADALGLLPQPEPLEFDAGGKSEANFSFTNATLSAAPPPAGQSVPPSLRNHLQEVAIKNLKPGRYTLKYKGEPVATADHREWADGVSVSAGPAQDAAEELRQTIVDKNQQFFYRWRAVNGEYIYGRRKEPFGVISFPPEMQKLDEMIRSLDQTIWYLSKPQPGQAFELVPAGR